MFGNKSFCVRASMAALVAAVLLAVAVVVAMVVVVRAKDQTCQSVDLHGLANLCGRFVQKTGPMMDPSPGCCDVINKGTDVMCVCQHLPKNIEQMLDMGKVAYVAQFCGKPLPRGVKCSG